MKKVLPLFLITICSSFAVQAMSIEDQINQACAKAQAGFEQPLGESVTPLQKDTYAQGLDQKVIDAYNRILKSHPEIINTTDLNASKNCYGLVKNELEGK